MIETKNSMKSHTDNGILVFPGFDLSNKQTYLEEHIEIGIMEIEEETQAHQVFSPEIQTTA